MSAGVALEARDIHHAFRTGFSLDVPTLSVAAGTTLALLGPSGSGKSTLLSILGLLERPDSGTILLDGTPVSARDRQARLSMAAVFQRPYLIKGTVAANVEYGMKMRDVPASERSARAESALARVGLAGMGARSVSTLSGGEAHRVALARALVLSPRVLLLDEPLASLDALLKRRLIGEFSSILRDEGITVVWVTHDQNEALVVADEVAILNAGRIVASGAASRVMTLPTDEWTARFLGVEVPLQGVVRSCEGGVMAIEVGSVQIAAMGDLAVGTGVLVSIPPEDVVLLAAGEEPMLTSARNRLEAVVESAEPRGATLRLALELGGARIAAAVSRTSFHEMDLAPGRPVGVLFKATAVHVQPLAAPTVEGVEIPAEV